MPGCQLILSRRLAFGSIRLAASSINTCCYRFHGMLVAEQGDDDDEDLKDLVKDMGLEDDEVAQFCVAIVELPRVKARAAKEAKEAKQAEEATSGGAAT